VPTSTYEAIQSYTLPSNQSSVNFTVIPQTFTDLVIVANYEATENSDFRIQINGDNGGSLYSTSYIVSAINNLGPTSASLNNHSYIGGYYTIGTSPAAQMSKIEIMNYTNSTMFKPILNRVSSVDKELTINVSMWRNTAPITSVLCFTNNTFFTNSVFTLYGIKAA
jgi:hypothetical protein